MAAQGKTSAAAAAFDPLTITSPGLQALLQKGTLTSTEIVDVYLKQIAKHNGKLHAVLSTISPELLKTRISDLDAERSSGRVRGPLHGIPVLIKDNLVTSTKLGMPTTSGAFGLLDAESSYNAAVVDQLLEAGAIILGKTNLSELSFWKGGGLPCGWSATGGQSQSAYVRGGVRSDDTFGGHSNPGGSSSGSAIAVSAGFAPIAIGTETDGSLMMPANRASLYSLKPTHGFSSAKGIVPVSLRLDTVGPMAKSPEEVGIVLDILAGNTSKYATAAENKSWSDIRVGVLDPNIWKQPPGMIKPDTGASAQMLAEVNSAYAKIKPLVKTFHENVDFIPVTELAVDGTTRLMRACYYDFAPDLNAYLASLKKSPVRSLEDLIKYNEEHAAKALPEGYSTQDMLSKSLKPGISRDEDAENWRLLRETGRERGIDATLKKYDIDVILAPADSPATKFPSAAGYPDITLPLSYLDFNGRPFGVVALASSGQEELLLRVAGAWQATFPARSPPPMLVEDNKGPQDSLL